MLRLDVIVPGARGVLARRPKRVGLGDAVSDYQATLTARASALGGEEAAALKAQTGVDVTQQRVSKGAQAALALAQSGYNPSSSGDNDNLVAAIAGGAALIPGIGPVIGAGVEGLYQVGKVAACPIENAFASIGLSTKPPECGGAPCSQTGAAATAASVIAANAGDLPTHDAGSFGAVAVGALALGAARALNCRGTLPPGVIVDSVVRIWNQTHAGPAVPYFVPPLNQVNKGLTAYGSSIIIPTGATGGTANTPATRAHKDPNAFYAFFPVGTTSPDSPRGSLPTGAGPWTPWYVANPPPGENVDPPRVVMVNTGAAIPQTATVNWGIPAEATSISPGRTYLLSGTVPQNMTEAQFLAFAASVGWRTIQVLFWGPTKAVDDPNNYIGQAPWLAALHAWSIGAGTASSNYIALAEYGGAAVPKPATLDAWDVTGSVTARQTVLGSGATTALVAAVGTVVVAAAGGSLYALIQKQAVGYFWGKVFDKAIDGGKSLYRRLT